jgi:anti-sigma factor RsiW
MNARTVRDMGCRELVEAITDYLEGTLPLEDVERFQAHLGECDGCQRYLDQMRATIAAMGRIRPESLTAEQEQELLAAFRDWRAGR